MWLLLVMELGRLAKWPLFVYTNHPGGLTLITSCKPNYSQRPHLLIPSCWGLRLQHMNMGEKTNMQFITVIFSFKN